jgi:hypothetical protein
VKKLSLRQAALAYASAWHRCNELQLQFGLNTQNAARAKKYVEVYDKADSIRQEAEFALLRIARQLVKPKL